MKTSFTVTEEHIRLIRRFNVGWQSTETGAPEIDPKRPYGNRSVANDIHEILTGELIGCVQSKRDELTGEEIEKYLKLHRETEVVLQIVLATGSFNTGTYEREMYTNCWKRVSTPMEEKPSSLTPVFCGDRMPPVGETVLLDNGHRYCVGFLRPDGHFYAEQDGERFYAQYWQPLAPLQDR